MEEEDATDQRPHSSITKKAQWKQIWIRKEPDEDGYFLLQLATEPSSIYSWSIEPLSLLHSKLKFE